MSDKISWTKEQTEAIETHGKNILIAAAAGSGKTAVLVERVIRMICNEENPVSVDRLLILTFTTAAADEMKRKISAAINKKLAENPENTYLKEQSIKVNSAAISTIHSFCSRIIGNNAHLTNLPADYTLIADTAENDLLINRALDEVLEAYYSRIDKKDAFRRLVLSSGTKDDKELREIIIKIYKFSQSLANPAEWFAKMRTDLYKDINTKEDFINSSWYLPLKNQIKLYADTVHNTLTKLTQIITDAQIPADSPHYKYYFNLLNDFSLVYERTDFEKTEDFMALCDFVSAFKFPRVSTAQKFIGDIKPTLNFYRKEVAASALEKAKNLIRAFDPKYIDNFAKSAPIIRTLCNIVQMLSKTHKKLKRERSAIDFNDLEHELLKLIRTNNGKETPLCKKLRDHYAEIMLDEFQDTNALQFEIFSRLSKPEGNLFMVGDVKQSIYKFRNADPSIFLNLYNTYAKEEGGHLIRLFKNFRSRDEVVDSVNHIFDTIMNRETGGIDYTKEEYLIRGASYPQGDLTPSTDYTTEIMINYLPEDVEDEITHKKINSKEVEAEQCVNRLIRLIRDEKFCITDKESGTLRPARYGDIAVLAPNWSGCTCIETAFNNAGISCFCEKSSHYLDSVEVSTVISFLQITDNPLQDIPLIAVLRSPIFSFTANELAEIRCCSEGRFYTAVAASAKIYEDFLQDAKAYDLSQDTINPDDDTNILLHKKSYDFINTLKDLRHCSTYMGVDEIVRKICCELDYLSIVSVMKDGEIRKANLKLLMKRCSEFEDGTLHGLFNFVQYIENLRASNEDLRPASDTSDFKNTVTVMTIHKSKGLEFPIVLLFGMDKKVNISDSTKRFVWNAETGIATDYVDTDIRVCYDMPQKSLISNEIRKELYAERIRLLYVAMTRAKEKLIISATQQKTYSAWKNAVFTEDKKMHPTAVLSMPCMRDWIWGSLLAAPDGRPLRELGERIDILPNHQISAKYKVYFADTYQSGEDTANTVQQDSQNTQDETKTITEEELTNRIDYKYKFRKNADLPIKLSVSELKRRQMPDDEYSVNLISPQKGLIHSTEELSAAERGTITHYVMQHIDIYNTDTKEDIYTQLEDMVKKGIITENQNQAVDGDSIYAFFASPLGKRLKSAEWFEREYDFYMMVSAKEAFVDAEDDAEIMVQGIADCLFYDKDTNSIVLIDYKTDRISAEKATEQSRIYQIQTNYYSKGLEAVFNLPITEKYLYFLNCDTAVKMP